MVGSKEFSLFSCCSLCLWQTLCTWASEVRLSQHPFLCSLWMTASLYLAPLVDQWIVNPSLLLPSWWALSSISAGLRQYIFYHYSNNVPNFAWIQVWAGFLPIPAYDSFCVLWQKFWDTGGLCACLRGVEFVITYMPAPLTSFRWFPAPLILSHEYWVEGLW